MLKKILHFIIAIFFIFSFCNADSVPVEQVFKDITKNYKYYNELQTLYDRWMIFPDSDGNFNPKKLLNRDEFVWISLEVSCKRCISPNTDFEYIKKYSSSVPFFDVLETNKYFYCISESDANNYVKWYGYSYVCEDWTWITNEKPFCVNNKITLEEAIAVILRTSWIFTIEDNEKILKKISSWELTENLSSDVSVKTSNGIPYTFYWYLEKALEYKLLEYDTNWKEKIYPLLTLQNNKIYPKKSISKEEFLYIAYIALKANSCRKIEKNNLAINMKILDSKCNSNISNCKNPNFTKTEKVFDFKAEEFWVCDKWISATDSYIWRFYNLSTWEEIKKYGKYIDNYDFFKPWNYKIYLRVTDNCWNSWEVYSSINIWNIWNNNNDSKSLWVDMMANPIYWVENLKVDFSSLVKGWTWNYSYFWNFWDWKSSNSSNPNHTYTEPWSYKATLIVTDSAWNSGTSTVTITVTDKNNWNNSLKVWINAVPIFWDWPLNVDFEALVDSTSKNLSYFWDFWDWKTGFSKNISHIFSTVDTFTVKLFVKDDLWNTWEATVIIKVNSMNNCELDFDEDWIKNCQDKCPEVKWNNLNYWCPIFDEFCASDCSCKKWYTCSSKVQNECSTKWVCLPDTNIWGWWGNWQQQCLEEWQKWLIYWNVVCLSCPCDLSLDFKAEVRKCDQIFPAITSPDSKEIYSRWWIYQVR